LQPRAASSILLTSCRPAPATLNEQVKVSTMMSPKTTSETRSMGSRMRLGDVALSAAILQNDFVCDTSTLGRGTL